MIDRRRKDANWRVADEQGNTHGWNQVQVAVLMDLRDELKRLNELLHCVNFIRIPTVLDKIAKNTTRKRKKRAA